MSKNPADKPFSREVIREYLQLRKQTPRTTELSRPFSVDEVDMALSQMKSGKAAGFDGMYPEFLIHTRPTMRTWLANFMTDVMQSNQLPVSFKHTKIIALLKPGKPAELPESYRPVALLSVTLKLLERLLHNRISPLIDAIVPPDQAGYRSGRSCTDQVLALTNHIENGFERKLKTGMVFIDLTAAFDTVWKKGLLCKFLKVVPCLTICDLLCNMLSNRYFKVFLNDSGSSSKRLNNGLPQGSILAPLLFNLYMSDLPSTKSRKFVYADDIALAIQRKNFTQLNTILTDDLERCADFFRKWRLKPSTSKTEVSCFHLDNRQSMAELQVECEGQLLSHNHHPKYLGMVLDRTLTYKKHLLNLRAKLNTRNNIINKLAATSWGASAKVLRVSSLSLVYSTADYCSPVWLNSAHVKLVDTQLNNSMRNITGTVRSTPTPWLPVLSNIPPPDLRRKQFLVREYQKAKNSPGTPLHEDLEVNHPHRLRSRRPPLRMAEDLVNENFNLQDKWKEKWEQSHLRSPLFDFDADRSTEFDLQRKLWTTLNRLRTCHGRTKSMMKKWNYVEDASCDCGHENQTVDHILNECSIFRPQFPLHQIAELTDEAKEYLKSLNFL